MPRIVKEVVTTTTKVHTPVKKKRRKAAAKKKPTTTTGTPKVEKALVNNFVSLQKVLTNLAIKQDRLSEQIAKLLDLFEISAKAMAEKNFEIGSQTNNKELLEKLDRMLNENKVIARGLTMMHDRGGGIHNVDPRPSSPQNQILPQPFQAQQTPPQPPTQTQELTQDNRLNTGEYQKSITSTGKPQRRPFG